jgi:hypothetical protein
MSASPAFVGTTWHQDRRCGMAVVASDDPSGGRIYLCDPVAHAIHVLDQRRRPLFSFGGFGRRLGQFDTPTDVAIAWTEPGGPSASTDVAVLAVADRGNHRVQLFELDGAPLGAVGDGQRESSPSRWPARAGWPFFRLGSMPPFPFPSRIEWHAPYLDIACMGTVMVRLDLAVALLPDFTTWIADAPISVLQQAFRRFTADADLAEIPDWCLLDIVERLQPAAHLADGSLRLVGA